MAIFIKKYQMCIMTISSTWKYFLLKDQHRKITNKPVPFFHFFTRCLWLKQTKQWQTGRTKGVQRIGVSPLHMIAKKKNDYHHITRSKLAFNTLGPWEHNAQKYRTDSSLNSDLLKIIKVPNNKKSQEFSKGFSQF